MHDPPPTVRSKRRADASDAGLGSAGDANAVGHTRLLDRLLLALFAVGFVSIGLWIVLEPAPIALLSPSYLYGYAAVLLFGLAWWLNRASHYLAAVLLAITTLSVVTFIEAAVVSDEFQAWLTYYLVVPVIVGVIYLSYRAVAIVIAANLAALIAIPAYRSDVELTELPILFLAMVTALVLVARRHIEKIESLRRRELDESRKRYERLLETSFGALVIVERDTITETNPVFSEVFGYSHDELVGRALSGILPGWSGDLRSQELVGLRKDGTQVELESISSDLDDTPGVRIIALRDISARNKALEKERLLEKQLQQSQRMETLGRLAGGVAHDFNNLLTPIMGYAQLAIAHAGPESPFHQDLEQINLSAARAADLTRQLLAFSRSQVLEMRNLDMNESIQSLSKMLRRLIGEDIEVSLDLSPDLGTIKADPTQLTQIVLNLAVNARDAMPNGGTLRIKTSNAELDEAYASLHPEIQPGRYAMLEVSDTGMGIDPAIQPHIFEPFFTTKGVHEGTGLGLATVHGIVKQHGGCIWLYSEAGLGATFRIYLPRVDALPQPLGARADDGPLPGGAESILVIEDSDAVRALVKRVLAECGYNVREFRTGEDAIAYASESHPIDLVVSDVIMPHMNGFQLVEKLRNGRGGVRALFMSGYTADLISRHASDAAQVRYIQKPFSVRELATRVRETLDE